MIHRFAAFFGLLWCLVLHAHIGSPFVLFEGRAGAFPVRISIREPDVVPGLAEITVRVLQGEPQQITVLPLDHNADRAKAPRPDIAVSTPGDPQLYSASLWFMRRGSYGVEVNVEGNGGGRVLVPVDSLARRQEPMGPLLSGILVGLGILLVGGYISIVASAASQSRLGPEVTPRARLSLRTFLGATLATGIMGFLLWGGSKWWAAEDADHQARVLFRPLENRVTVSNTAAGRQILLALTDKRSREDWARLIPDHGKLIHLFLTEESNPNGRSVGFGHLHPQPVASGGYQASFPPLRPGTYRVYADLAHESGLTETITNRIEVTESSSGSWSPSDADDSFDLGTELKPKVELSDGLTLELVTAAIRPGVPVELRALVRNAQNQPVPIQPFLRMLGHAVVERSDGSVFAHVHPAGTLSMAIARRLAVSAGGEDGGKAADVNCGDLSAVPVAVAESLSRGGEVTFPYVFPESGEYRIWVQVRVDGRVRTGAFLLTVPASSRS
jgi:hypothetical protein